MLAFAFKVSGPWEISPLSISLRLYSSLHCFGIIERRDTKGKKFRNEHDASS